MSGPLIFTGSYAIREGKLDEAKSALAGLVKHVETNEPGLLHFGFYIDETDGRVTCVQVHPDAGSMERHLKVIAGHLKDVGDFLDFTDMQTRVYGVPGDGLLAELREMDGDALKVAAPLFGFDRFAPA